MLKPYSTPLPYNSLPDFDLYWLHTVLKPLTWDEAIQGCRVRNPNRVSMVIKCQKVMASHRASKVCRSARRCRGGISWLKLNQAGWNHKRSVKLQLLHCEKRTLRFGRIPPFYIMVSGLAGIERMLVTSLQAGHRKPASQVLVVLHNYQQPCINGVYLWRLTVHLCTHDQLWLPSCRWVPPVTSWSPWLSKFFCGPVVTDRTHCLM